MIKELFKLMITTCLLPIMIIFLIGITFIAIHEGIWHSKEWKTNS
jgi:hypothetical protein